MKKLSTLFLCLMSTAVFAANSHPVTFHLPKGAKINKQPLVLEKSMKAQMSCNVYSVQYIDDDNSVVTFLGNVYSQVLDVGTPTQLSLRLPAPYDDMDIMFQHGTVSFIETGFNNFTPYVYAGFYNEKTGVPDEGDWANFTINDARSGSNISIRSEHSVSDDTTLFSQCALTYLK